MSILAHHIEYKRQVLENASKHFDDSDSSTVCILEAMYGQESSNNHLRGKRNAAGPAADFQTEKKQSSDLLALSSTGFAKTRVAVAGAITAKMIDRLSSLVSFPREKISTFMAPSIASPCESLLREYLRCRWFFPRSRYHPSANRMLVQD